MNHRVDASRTQGTHPGGPGASARDLAVCGLFGAAALLLPVVFHLVKLGHVFMPMYLPLVALAFYASPAPAALTALLVPLVSSMVTGMPPMYPPVAPLMAMELATMVWLLSTLSRWLPRAPTLALLVPVLALGRVLYAAMAWVAALVLDLPARFVAGISLLSGWPGVILMTIVIPPLVRVGRRGQEDDT